MTTSSGAPEPSRLACVVLAHSDPAQVRRLIDALDPFPVLLHCDRRTPATDSPAEELRAGVEAAGWAMWEETVGSTPLPVRQRHMALVAGKPDASFSPDDQRVRAAVERSLHRPDRSRSTRIPAPADASTPERLALRTPA